MLENGPERETKEIIFDEVWSKRGTNSKPAEGTVLPVEWKSGYGLPLVIALKESSLFLERFDDYYKDRDGGKRKRVFCLGLFEDRTLGCKSKNLVPIGYIYLQEIEYDQTQMVCSDTFTMGKPISTIVSDNGTEIEDPLFSKLVKSKHVPLAAISIGSDTTYENRRGQVISKLSQVGRRDDGLALEEMIKDPRAIKSGGDKEKLEDFQHTHQGLGQLLLAGAVDICKRTGHNKLHLNTTNNESRNLIYESPFKYKEETVRGFKNLILDVI
ncbi:MAG: hypothetical protein ACD_61C00282G0010 [uncultured bacterium]|nr:MAG: hypothetical protein ACD_61C00282G0010 [uncultured bacterium]